MACGCDLHVMDACFRTPYYYRNSPRSEKDSITASRRSTADPAASHQAVRSTTHAPRVEAMTTTQSLRNNDGRTLPAHVSLSMYERPRTANLRSTLSGLIPLHACKDARQPRRVRQMVHVHGRTSLSREQSAPEMGNPSVLEWNNYKSCKMCMGTRGERLARRLGTNLCRRDWPKVKTQPLTHPDARRYVVHLGFRTVKCVFIANTRTRGRLMPRHRDEIGASSCADARSRVRPDFFL
jgi:hypothetical protein